MRVLGIDPGSLVTGYGIVSKEADGRLSHICDGQVAFSSGPLSKRLFAISEALIGVIEEFKPDEVAVETLFYGKNVKSSIVLGHARGVALLCAASKNLAVSEYSPRTIKQAITGYGNATKEQVQKMIKLLLKAPTASKPDAADALAVAVCHINHLRKGLSTEGMREKSSLMSVLASAPPFGRVKRCK